MTVAGIRCATIGVGNTSFALLTDSNKSVEDTWSQRVEYILKFDETPMSFHVYVLMKDLPKTWCYFKYCRIGVKNTSTEKIWFPCHYLDERLTAGVP